MMESSTFNKFKCDLKYISDKLKNVENKTKLSSTHTVTDNGGIPILNNNKLKDMYNSNNSHNLKDDESKSKTSDLCNLKSKTASSDQGINRDENSTSVCADPPSFDTFSIILEENQPDKDDLKNKCLKFNRVKKAAKEADQHLKKLNEQRIRSADITSDIGQRNLDIPLTISLNFKSFTIENNEKPQTITNPKSTCQEKHVNVDNTCKAKNSHQLSCSPEKPKSIKNYKNNIGFVNFIAKDTNKEDNSDCNIKNLQVQQTPSIVIKPDLIIQKVSNVVIKPDCKKTCSNKSVQNVSYHEVLFDVEPETCKCQSSQSKCINDNTVARYEIRKILCGILDDMLLNNDPLCDPLISKLQKIMTNLEDNDLLEQKKSNEVENLIEEHSVVGFSEMVIKKKLLEMAENIDDEKSFEEMAEKMENFYQHVDNRLTKLKNLYLEMNSQVEFQILTEDTVLADVSNSINANPGNIHPNETFQPKNFDDINFISNHSECSKMPEQIFNLKEPNSEIKTNGCLEDMTHWENNNSSNINEITLMKSRLTKFEDHNFLKNNNNNNFERVLINNQVQDSKKCQSNKQENYSNSISSKSSPSSNIEFTDLDSSYKVTGDSSTSTTSVMSRKQTTQEIGSCTKSSVYFEVDDYDTYGLHKVDSKTSITENSI